MEPIPLPSHIHYELLLQLLERKTSSTVTQQPMLREQVQQLIISLRKAVAQQKQIETTCEQMRIPFEYRWSLNSTSPNPENSANFLPTSDNKLEN